MASFKVRQEKKRLPSAPEGSSIGGASLYDAFVESLWGGTMDEYNRKGIGFGGYNKAPIPYPSKETWWSAPRSRLDLSSEYHK